MKTVAVDTTCKRIVIALMADRRSRKLKYMAGWRARNPNRKREWDIVNHERVQAYDKAHRQKNATREKQTFKAWCEKNREHLRATKKDWYSRHPESRRATNRKMYKRRMETDPSYVLHGRLKTLVQFALKNKLGRRTFDIVGCESDFFLKWIRSLFLDGMTFENRSKWHLDHIFPIACCGNSEGNIRLAQNYKNLRPMWAKDNHRKSYRLTDESIVAAYLCGITEIHLSKRDQCDDRLLLSAKRLGFKVFTNLKK